MKCPKCGSSDYYFQAKGPAGTPQKVRCNTCRRLGTLLEFSPPKKRVTPLFIPPPPESLWDKPHPSRILLMSLRPQYATAMLNGLKTIELRRIRPHISYGDIVLFYVTAPVQAITIIASVDRVVVSEPAILWEADVGISQEEFESYFEGAEIGYAIHLREIRRVPSVIPLSVMRDKGVSPPQCYCFLTRAEFAALRIGL